MKRLGFTLAELLISLTILGVISTFTIPKVLTAQQNGRSIAIAKETAAMISGAYENYRWTQTVTANTATADLTPYMNYVSTISGSYKIDDFEGSASKTCNSGAAKCLQLHNGAVLYYFDNISFGGTNTTNAIYFFVDPDGVYSGQTSGASKSIAFDIYTNGFLTTYGKQKSGTTTSFGVESSCPTCDPTWFSW